MSAAGKPIVGANRAGALLVVALLILAPAAWIGWSVRAASATAETAAAQSDLLAKLRSRAAALPAQAAAPGATPAESVFLPGTTPAIAGAALQKLVADAVDAAGGRVIETEFARVETPEANPGRVDLRVAFDADIVALQQILFRLETGLPVLLVRSLDVQSAAEATEAPSPPLRVLMLIGGNWKAAA